MNLKNAWTRLRLWLLRKIYPSRAWGVEPHEIEFKNGSKIRSFPSGSIKGTLCDREALENHMDVPRPPEDHDISTTVATKDIPWAAAEKYMPRHDRMDEIRDDGPDTLEDLLALYKDMVRDPQRPNVLLITSTPTGKPNVFAAAVRKQLEAKGFRMELNAETGFYEIKEPPRTT